MFYLLFGRLGYRSDTPPTVWQRELRQRFGESAEPIERAYRSASRVMPLLTTVQQWSASIWSYWPELFAGRTLDQDLEIEPSDPTQFYGVKEYVEDALRGDLCGNRDLPLELRLESSPPVRSVRCYYRSAHQAWPFQRQEMTCDKTDLYQTTIPGSQIESRWDLMVFFEVMLESGEGLRWPDWRTGPPYRVIETVASR